MTGAALALKPQKPTLRFPVGVPAVQREVTGTQACSRMPKGKTAAKRAGQGPPFRAEVPHPVELPAPRRGSAVNGTGHRVWVKTVIFTRGWLMHAHECRGAARLAAERDGGPTALSRSCGTGECMSCDTKILVPPENTRHLLLMRSLSVVYSTGVRQWP